jgi:beta-lactam-binding protein with PASTA domain
MWIRASAASLIAASAFLFLASASPTAQRGGGGGTRGRGAQAGSTSPSEYVPDLHGKTINQADAELEKARLRLGEIGKEPSDQAEATVIRQEPNANEPVPSNRQVRVWLAVPIPTVEVPYLRGADLATATSILNKTRLRLGNVASRKDDSEPVGSVIDQLPLAGTPAREGTEIAIWLAEAIQVTVPRLRDLDRDKAEAALANVGLKLGKATDLPSDAAIGTVINQDPKEDTLVARGTEVAIVLSTRPVPVPAPAPIPSVPVPDLHRLDTASAANQLTQFQLHLGNVAAQVSPYDPVGTVVSQLPASGAYVQPGTAVSVVLAEAAWWQRWLPWILVGIVGLVLGVTGHAAWQKLHATSLSITPQVNPGVQELWSDGPLVDWALTVDARPDRGLQELSGPTPLVTDIAEAPR